MNIHAIPDEACPRCGAYWGHPDTALNYPNRPKVDNAWRCYNPECTAAYYEGGKVVEDEPTPEEAVRMLAWVEDIVKGSTITVIDHTQQKARKREEAKKRHPTVFRMPD